MHVTPFGLSSDCSFECNPGFELRKCGMSAYRSLCCYRPSFWLGIGKNSFAFRAEYKVNHLTVINGILAVEKEILI